MIFLSRKNDILKQYQAILKKYQVELLELKNIVILVIYVEIEVC